MNEPNELAEIHQYIQVLRVQKDKLKTAEDVIVNDIKGYIYNALNKFDIVFYKAHMYEDKRENTYSYTIHFHLFSKDETSWNTDIEEKLIDQYLKTLLNYHGLRLAYRSTQTGIYEQKREPHDMCDDPREHRGPDNIPGSNCCEKFISWWLIVPRVQWDFFDLLYQMYTFDITHQGFIPKFVHFFTIPTNVMLSMCFMAQFQLQGYGAFAANAALIMWIILSIMYLVMGVIRKATVWGMAMTVILFVCWLTGNLWYHTYKMHGNPWYNPTTTGSNPLLWSYIISFIQASSHMIVPQLPPYITGAHHWESLHVFFCRRSSSARNRCTKMIFIIGALACFPVLSVAVAWFSWPHLIGTEIIYIMAGIGYLPHAFKKYFTVIEKAELSGNPILSHYPTKPEEMMNNARPLVQRFKDADLVSDKPDNSDIIKCMATLHLCKHFFGNTISRRSKNYLDHVPAVLRGMR